METTSPDLSRFRLYSEVTLILTANPGISFETVGSLVGISAREVRAIVTSPLGKALWRMNKANPPPNLQDFKLD